MKIDLKDSDEKKQKSKPRIKRNDDKVKIRQLGKKETKGAPKKRINLQIFRFIIIPLLISLTSVIIYQLSQIKSCEFWSAYERNFNKIVYGDEFYCNRLIGSQVINQLKMEVAAQDDALELIRGSLELANRERIVRMAFNGDVGTGKSLAADIITRYFPWKGNFVKLTWEEGLKIDISSLSKCGFNLIIIDNMDFNSTTIEYAKSIEQELLYKSKSEAYRIILILIFKGSHEELNKTDGDSNAMQEILKNFVIVDFQSITREGFERCLEIFQKLYNIQITPQEFNELIEIDYKSTGCKLISKRLNLVKL